MLNRNLNFLIKLFLPSVGLLRHNLIIRVRGANNNNYYNEFFDIK